MRIIDKFFINENLVLEHIEKCLIEKKSLLLTYFNVHCFYVYHKNLTYKNLIEQEFITYPDGTGIWLFMKKLGKNYKRFNATDLNYEILRLIIKYNLNSIIISGNFDLNIVQNKFNQLNYKSFNYINGFLNNHEILKKVSELNSDVILIGMGVPKQEILAEELSKVHKSSVIVCVGNFFNFFFGIQKRAPKIFQKFGLEWLYRFMIEPKRLFYRYTVENLFFIWKLITTGKN